jgi:group I intron endonuclease
MTCAVYRITRSLTGQSYIGSTKNLRKRFYWHRKSLAENRHHAKHLQNAWNKYGVDAFEFIVVEFVDHEEDLLAREQYWLDAQKAANGVYNSRVIAASNSGYVWSASARENLSRAKKGRKQSPEHRAALSAVRKGKKRRPMSEETRAKISAANKGRDRSPEIREIMSAARRGKNLSLEHAAISAAHCRKMGQANRGRIFTVEHKAALSAARHKYVENAKAIQRPVEVLGNEQAP